MCSILYCWRWQYRDRVLRYLSIHNPTSLDQKKKKSFWAYSGKTSIYKEELSYFKLNVLTHLAQYVV